MDDSLVTANEELSLFFPGEIRLIDVTCPHEGLFLCTHANVDIVSRQVTQGRNKLTMIVRAPCQLYKGDTVGKIIPLSKKRKRNVREVASNGSTTTS